MPHLTIVPDAETTGFSAIEALKSRLGIPKHPNEEELARLNEHLHHLAEDAEIQIGGLERGMASGKPSLALVFVIPGGEVVLAETSLALFLTAADAFKARFGDPR